VQVEVLSKASGAPPSGRVAVLLTRVARKLRCRADEVSVLFCGDSRMRRLNRLYRGQDRPTDVLAFPARDGHLLGDIVVSVPYASRQAQRHKETVSREVDRLLLHGFLHLMGYDHETDSGQMDALEKKLRRRLGLLGAADRASRRGRQRR
jgi:probable rRNA maturation factor